MRRALESYELGAEDEEDEQDVDFEGIELGNGQYEKIQTFSKTSLKYQRLIKALQVIKPI